jgi:hypothetical protein
MINEWGYSKPNRFFFSVFQPGHKCVFSLKIMLVNNFNDWGL